MKNKIAVSQMLDLSQSGLKIEIELKIRTNNVWILLEVSFVIVKEKYEFQCKVIWSKSLGKVYQYGLKFNV